MANHLKGSNLLPNPVQMGAVPDGVKAWCNIRSAVPPPLLDGGQMVQDDYLDMWTAWVAAFTLAKLGLYKLPATELPPTADVTALTQPAGSWYVAAGQATTILGPWLNNDNSVEVGTTAYTWVYSGVSAAETIYGAWINDVF